MDAKDPEQEPIPASEAETGPSTTTQGDTRDDMRPYPLVALLGAVAATVIPYQLPAIYPTSTVWKVSVDGKNVPVTSNTNYSYARFAMSGHVNVTIDSLVTSTVDTIRISPKKLGIKPWASGSRVSFTLKDDAYLIVKINSLLEIVIIADALEWKAPRLTDTGVHNVLDAPYQADATGATLTTASFQDAIDNATAQFSSLAGTGASHSIVYVPNGVYTVGNLYLKSNVALYLESSAVLRFSGKHSDYRIDYHKDSQNRDVTWWISTAFNSTNTKIFGRGILDGNGFNSTTTSNPQIGNNILVPIATTGFVADGITALDSGAWSITPIRSKDVTFTNFKFLNRLDMGENDCIDVMESTNVKVSHAIGISLDDPFSTKSWTATNISADIAQNWPGKPQILQDVVVDDTVAWTRTFGYKIGQGVYQPHTDVKFSNGVVYDCSIGLGIDHRVSYISLTEMRTHPCMSDRFSSTARLQPRVSHLKTLISRP